MPGKYVVKKTKGGKFSFNLQAGNGRVILTSQRYQAKASALGGVKSVKKNGKADKNFNRKTAKDGSPYFTLESGNGEVIGTSEMYSSKSAMENGIASVKKNCGSAVRDDT